MCSARNSRARLRSRLSGDDEYVGFVLGFSPGDDTNSSADYLLVDWKQGTQTANFGGASCTPGSTAYRGLAVSRVSGLPTADEFWGHVNFDTPACSDLSHGLQELARGATLGSTGWGDNQENEFTFEYDSTRLRVFVNGTLEIDITAAGNPFPNGRIGFYNLSQGSVRYSSFQSDTIVGDEGSPVNLSKDFTDPGILDTHTATIIWGDGDTTPGGVSESNGDGTVSGSHTYDDNGTYTVTVEVCDKDNDGDSDTLTANISNVDPTLTNIFQVAPIYEGNFTNIVAQATDPADANDPLSFTFDCDNNGSYETAAAPNTSAADCFFDDDGIFTVNVRVTDGDGGEDTGSVTDVEVLNRDPTAFLSNDGPVDEGSPATISFSNQFDPSNADNTAGFRYAYDCDGGSLTGADYDTPRRRAPTMTTVRTP